MLDEKENTKDTIKIDYHLLNLVVLGTELCSIYMRDKDSESGHISRALTASKDSIVKYLNDAGRAYGYREAIRSSKFLLNNSNSPRETVLSVFFVLNPSLGGFGLPEPELNALVRLTKEAHALYPHDIWVDWLWRAAKTVNEYDSDEFHMDSKQHAKDSERQNALIADGYKVIRITTKMLRDFEITEKTLVRNAKYIGANNVNRLGKYKKLRQAVLGYLLKCPVHEYFTK